MESKAITGVSILHIITRLDKGGSAEVVLELARLLAADGARVGIAVGKTDDPQEDLDAYSNRTGVTIHHVPELVREVSPFPDTAAFFKIRRLLRHLKPDIVHTHTSKAGIIGRFAAWTAGSGPVVHTPHGHIFYGYYGGLSTSFFVLLERTAARITDRITILTEAGRRDHIDKRIGPASLFEVIPSGVNVRWFAGGDRPGLRAEIGAATETVIGWVGRLVPIKDCATFVRAAALIHERHPAVRFVVAGDGGERNDLERLAEQLDLNEKLVFLGNRNDIPSVMAAMDVFVLSSLNEGFGRVIVEAMASGTPVVSTNVGGTSDVVEDGVSGILVPPSDPRAIADAVCRILDDTDLHERFVQKGKERARDFDLTVMVTKFEELYAELLSL